MIPLKANRRVLTWFSVYPPDKNATKWNRYAYITFTAVALAVQLCSFASDTVVFFKFLSTDVEIVLMALLQFFANGAMAYSIATMLILRHKINAIFESLSEIHKMCKKPFVCIFHLKFETPAKKIFFIEKCLFCFRIGLIFSPSI